MNGETLNSGRAQKLLCAAWIGGILAAGILVFALSAGFRMRALAASVNAALEERGAAFRVSEKQIPGGGMGYWFYSDGDASGRVCVFTVMQGGASALCAVLVRDGAAEALVPLSVNAGELRLPPSLSALYLRRAEKAAGRLR
ncbi:MAG: hypothetical protein LBN92_04785 [Treponema sp.]|jgi:hypothetical protein|nr:hypothetical protein [Treponema sp.]